MKISVVIPTYKPQNYFWECLDSLVTQTFPKEDFEIIIVLNGCNEPYKTSISKYIIEKMQGMNVRFIHTDIGGVSNARNIGLDNAIGEYISFIDDDDLVSTNYLENLFRVSSPICVGCTNSYAFKNNIAELIPNFLNRAYRKCKHINFSKFQFRSFLSPPVCKLIHVNIIKAHRFPLDLSKSEDSVFCMLISPNIKNMKLTSDDTIYYQRLREESAMRKKQSKSKILKEHLYIEYKYIIEWCKHPFRYNVLFVLSRMVACGKNCINYLCRSSI